MQPETTNRKLMWWGINILVLLYAFIPVIWIVSLSLKDAATLNDGNYFPTQPTGDSYAAIFSNPDFLRALANSIGICLIATLIAIVFGTMAVLIFITTGIIAFIFIKAFGAAAPGADPGGRR